MSTNSDRPSEPRPLAPDRFSEAAALFGDPRAAIFPAGFRVADLERPEIWSQVAHKLQRWNQIWCLEECGEWVALAVVVETGLGLAKVKVIGGGVIGGVGVPEDPGSQSFAGFDITYHGEHEKWRVSERPDNGGRVLKDKFASRAAAANWLFGHLQSRKR